MSIKFSSFRQLVSYLNTTSRPFVEAQRLLEACVFEQKGLERRKELLQEYLKSRNLDLTISPESGSQNSTASTDVGMIGVGLLLDLARKQPKEVRRLQRAGFLEAFHPQVLAILDAIESEPRGNDSTGQNRSASM